MENTNKRSGCWAFFLCLFKNKNYNPKELMAVATWWIKTHELDHFEKAVKIQKMIQTELVIRRKTKVFLFKLWNTRGV